MRFSVILNTYNRAHFLPRVFAAWSRMDPARFSMIVADDGSSDDTKTVLQDLGARAPFRVTHVWHEHDGHRRAEILNKAVHIAAHEALLFTDSDSLPAHDLLDVHGRCFSRARMLVGGYMRLDADYTDRLDVDAVRAGDYERQATPAVKRRLRWQHCKHVVYTLLHTKGRPHVMGLNMVIPRSGFVAVNGYDNNFRGWGRADGDLRERLKRVHVRPFSDWSRAMVFHMHHPEDTTKKQRANAAYAQREVIPTVAEHGFREVAADASAAVVWENGR